jgi:hypothetical protein
MNSQYLLLKTLKKPLAGRIMPLPLGSVGVVNNLCAPC